MMLKNIWLPLTISLIGLGANLVLDYLTATGQSGPQLGLRFYVFRVLALSAAVFPGLFALGRAEMRESARKRREQLDDLTSVLEASVRRLFPEENPYYIRANVMLASGDRLKVLCGWNMGAYPDSKMSLLYGQGAAGKVWKRATENPPSECWQPVYAPRAQLNRKNLKDKWLLGDDEIRLTSHILWVLSTPLLHRHGESLRFLGVLNLDGVTRPLNSMDVFEDTQFHLHCVALADHIADLIVQGDLRPT
jgi:hypothetical protein